MPGPGSDTAGAESGWAALGAVSPRSIPGSGCRQGGAWQDRTSSGAAVGSWISLPPSLGSDGRQHGAMGSGRREVAWAVSWAGARGWRGWCMKEPVSDGGMRAAERKDERRGAPLGKLGRYPPWPGKIVNPPKDLKKPRGKKCFFVKFFGTEDHAWIKVEQLKPYHPHKEEMIKINKGKRFQQAVDAVEEFLRKTKGKDQACSHNSTEEKNRRNSSEERGKQSAGEEKRKASFSEGKDLTIPESSTVKRVMTGTVAGFKWPPSVNEPVKDSDPHFHHFLLSQTEKPAVCYQAITKKLKVCEEETGSTSIQAADSTAVNGSITPTDKKIGFLGLGLMGSGIVSNLLKMGHTVTVWNRTAEKCDLFIQEGARLGRTPAEVVSTCDITFACVSDPKAAKDLVLGPSGVLQGIRPGKCYVDMSTVDADTVTELAQVIVSRGGRFLEAPVSGNQQLSNDGMLVILAAGDRGLYEDCSSCFQAMGKTSFFLGEVGNAAKMMLIVNMVQGSFMATIAEGLTLAQVTGQSQQTLLDILNQGQLASIFLDQKCQNILQGNFKPDFYLKYIQKDLRLAIALGDSVNHPTPMAAAANEVYKRAKALDQSDNDMSAVYRAYIH
ncbi:cytokine-like nuclear factor N-PAC isoform X3 [Malurus melanocephalus]|uniref:cytokine-like nuclear factor N-PAC isoform X3 n=1 Tax=Malurus melanocephalus TaxID=175006 RepID=UPI0025495080|nr:cytokine-like nuclear factor N-PAC isoform X3 [Malurus melanocephalus]